MWLVGTNEPLLVFSDHANLKYFMLSQKLTPRQARWPAYLSFFWFHILHTPGKFNPADPASRLPDYEQGREACPSITLLKPALPKGGVSVGALSTSVSSLDIKFSFPASGARDLLVASYPAAPTVSQSPISPLYSSQGVLWWYRDSLYAPPALCPRMLSAFHDSASMRHPGIAHMLSCLSRTYSWPAMRVDVVWFGGSCDSCQQIIIDTKTSTGKLQPLPIPTDRRA